MAVLAVRAEGDPLDPYLGDPGRTAPNLVPDVPLVRIDNYRLVDDPAGGLLTENGLFLLFDTSAQNLGAVPVQLTVDEVESPESSTVSQCVSWRSAEAHACRETSPVGGYAWHQAHQHFHYEDFARYQLRRLAPDGRPDYSDAGLVRSAEKVSFCFVDSVQVRDGSRPVQFYTTCLPTVQGISPGWADIYDYDTPGQNFFIQGLADGRYALIVELDYENTLHETSNDDNYVEVALEITGNLSQVAILEKRWPAPDDRGTQTTTTTTTKKKPKKK